MRVLTVFDLVAVLLLFAFGSIAAVSGEPLAILALAPLLACLPGGFDPDWPPEWRST